MIIDCHVHLLRTKNFSPEYSNLRVEKAVDTDIEALLKEESKAGVERLVVMGQDMTRIWGSTCGEEFVINSVKNYPDRLLGLASVEPLDRKDRMNREALSYFQQAIEDYGLRGLLLTPVYGHYCPNDKRVYPFYEKAVELNVPVQFHQAGQINRGHPVIAPFKYARPLLLDDVGIDFPELKIIVEHMGFPWTEELLAIMHKNPNVFADCSALFDRPTILTWYLTLSKEYDVVDRVMYGSDYFNPRVKRFHFPEEPSRDFSRWIAFIRTGVNQIASRSGWPTLSEQEIEGILGVNVARLYKL